MSILAKAVQCLNEVIIESYQSAFFDSPRRPELIFELYTHLRFKLRIYTFTQTTDVHNLYTSLSRGDIVKVSNEDLSFALLYLTELAQACFIKTAGEAEVSTSDAISYCITELSKLLSQHGHKNTSEEPTLDFYRNVLSQETWSELLQKNPWLIIAILFRYTGAQLPLEMMRYRQDMRSLKREFDL